MFKSRSICSLLLWVLSSFQLATALTCFGDNSHHTPGHSPNSGNANYLKYFEKLPWPPNSVGTRVVRYCFANEASADALSCLLEDAIGIWSDALGSGPNSGHSLAFRRVQPIIKNMQRVGYHNCFVDGAWNPAVGSDALVVSLDKTGPCATVGYEREEDAVAEGRPVSGRHKLLLPPPPHRVSKQQVAHELGHVLGMIHEMCRSDRNNYILFRCKKLEGYDVAFNKAMLDDPISALSNKLCTDKAFADKYGFIGGQYVMNAELGEGSLDTFDDDRFDMQSIMMYPSNTFAGNPACYGNPPNIDECPMVQLDKVGNTVVGTSPIYANPVPSDGDIRFIKRYYPPVGQLAAAGEVQPRHVPRTFSQILADEKSATSFNPAYRGNSVVRVHHVY